MESVVEQKQKVMDTEYREEKKPHPGEENRGADLLPGFSSPQTPSFRITQYPKRSTDHRSRATDGVASGMPNGMKLLWRLCASTHWLEA